VISVDQDERIRRVRRVQFGEQGWQSEMRFANAEVNVRELRKARRHSGIRIERVHVRGVRSQDLKRSALGSTDFDCYERLQAFQDRDESESLCHAHLP
jgi:hypothetical protein